jgi:SulP family sulfate permease
VNSLAQHTLLDRLRATSLGKHLGFSELKEQTLGAVLARDLLGGVVSCLVTIAFSLSFAAMIFAGDLVPSLPQGISMVLMCAGVTITIVSLTSPFYFAIAGPDSRPTAVQSTMAASLIAALHGNPGAHSSVLLALALSTVITGALLYLAGRLKMGRWIRYVPYPVISGFLAATGWVLFVGGLRVISDLPLSFAALKMLHQPYVVERLIVGLGLTAVFCAVLFQTNHFMWLPILLIGGTALTHVTLVLRGIPTAAAQEHGWLLRVKTGSGVWSPYHELLHALPQIDEHRGIIFWHFLGSVAVLTAVTAIGVLVTAAALEIATASDADLDQELKGHGLANVLSGLCGGVVGCNAIVRSALNRQAGAATRMSGLIAGLLCLAINIWSPQSVGLLARPVMGATLMYLGLRLLKEWALATRHKLKRSEYVVVLVMLVLIIRFGFVVGLATGLVASCITFAISYSQIGVVKHTFTCDEYMSKVQRSAEETGILRRKGVHYRVLRLRGYLFFGSIITLIDDMRRQIAESKPPMHALVLDFLTVNGMDTSAAHTFLKLRQTAERCNVQVVFCSLRPDTEAMLRRERCLTDDSRCLVQENLDVALEWCEQQILLAHASESQLHRPLSEWLARELGSHLNAQRFLSYVEEIELKPGEHLFRQGDPPSEVYVVASGRVGIYLELPDRPRLRLRSVTSNTTLGEMAVYRKSPRSASVICEAPTRVYRLSCQSIAQMEDEEPKLAIAFHGFVVRTMADRLGGSDKTIAALER